MDSILEKFSLYDLFGVYVPGALLAAIVKAFAVICGMSTNIPNETVKSVFDIISVCPNQVYFTLIAYFAGVLIHEVGKYISDKFKIYDLKKTENLVLGKFDTSYLHLRVVRDMAEYNHNSLICNLHSKDSLKDVPFEKALNSVRYSSNSSKPKASKYHSLYGLSRGMALDMLIEIVITILFGFLRIITLKVCLAILVVSVFTFIILYCRAYRYSLSWVKNIYLQYAYDNGLA